MSNIIKKQLLERKKNLLSVSGRLRKRIRNAPEGSLRISSTNKKRNRIQYYHRISESDRLGTYLPKSRRETAIRLAQKSYDQITLAAIQKEITAIDLYLRALPEIIPENVFYSLSESRKELVTSVFETDEMYLEHWEKKEYEGKEFSPDMPELYTDRGERVRSKSEVIIANVLNRYKIPYRYECPLLLRGLGTIYPDFTILNIKRRKEIYWEHQGMMDDPEYANKAISKETYYIKNGIFPGERLIITSETRSHPLNVREIELRIEHMLQDEM